MQTLINKILIFEKQYNLFDFQFKNYSVWSYYRMYFYYSIATDLGILDSSVSGFKKDFSYILKILNIFNLKKLFEKKDIFVLEHPRSNKDGIDIYTEDIVNYLGKEKCSFFAFSNNGVVTKKNNVVILDIVKILSKIYSKVFFKVVKIDDAFDSFLSEFQKVDYFKYKIQYKRYYLELKFQYYFYYLLLKFKRTKKVILVVSYYNMPLVFAAKNLGMEVIEMQHGVISQYHLGYHYPYYKTNFFPDKLYLFSDFWKESATYPKSNIETVGNSFLYTEKEKVLKEKDTILIVSQTTIADKLKAFLLYNIDKLDGYKIYFKLHPNEFNNYERNYQKLLEYENISIVTKQYTIHELQNFCEYQIGIYSTGIYEGIERQCKTLLLNDTGIEYMEQILKEKLAVLLNYEDNLKEQLKNAVEPLDIVFFKNFDLKVRNDFNCNSMQK